MSHNWVEEIFAVRGKEHSDVAAINEILMESTTADQYMDNTRTCGTLLRSSDTHSCHYTPTHASKYGFILAW